MKKVEEGKKKVISVKVASNGNYNLYFEGKKISVKNAKKIVCDYERCCRATSEYWFVDYDLYIDVKVASQLVIGDDYSKFVLFDGEIENVMKAVKTGACGQHIEFVPAKAENTDVEDDGSNDDDEEEENLIATVNNDEDEDDELVDEPEEIDAAEAVEEVDVVIVTKFEIGKSYLCRGYSEEIVDRIKVTARYKNGADTNITVEDSRGVCHTFKVFIGESYSILDEVYSRYEHVGNTHYFAFSNELTDEVDNAAAKQVETPTGDDDNGELINAPENETAFSVPSNIVKALSEKLMADIKTLSTIYTVADGSYSVFDVVTKAMIDFNPVPAVVDSDSIFNKLYQKAKNYFEEIANAYTAAETLTVTPEAFDFAVQAEMDNAVNQNTTITFEEGKIYKGVDNSTLKIYGIDKTDGKKIAIVVWLTNDKGCGAFGIPCEIEFDEDKQSEFIKVVSDSTFYACDENLPEKVDTKITA